MIDSFRKHSGCQFGPLLGLPGGSRCFNRVPRALLVRIQLDHNMLAPFGGQNPPFKSRQLVLRAMRCFSAHFNLCACTRARPSKRVLEGNPAPRSNNCLKLERLTLILMLIPDTNTDTDAHLRHQSPALILMLISDNRTDADADIRQQYWY